MCGSGEGHWGRLSMNKETVALECWACIRAQGSSEASEYMGSLGTKTLIEESLYQPHQLYCMYLPLADQGQMLNVMEPVHHPLVDRISLGPHPYLALCLLHLCPNYSHIQTELPDYE